MSISIFFDLATVLSFAATITLLEYTMTCVGTLVMRYCPPSLMPDEAGGGIRQISDDSANRGYSGDVLLPPQAKDIQLTSFWTDRRIFLLIWGYFLLCLFTAYIGFSYEFFMDELGLDVVFIVVMTICGGIILIQFCILYI